MLASSPALVSQITTQSCLSAVRTLLPVSAEGPCLAVPPGHPRANSAAKTPFSAEFKQFPVYDLLFAWFWLERSHQFSHSDCEERGGGRLAPGRGCRGRVASRLRRGVLLADVPSKKGILAGYGARLSLGSAVRGRVCVGLRRGIRSAAVGTGRQRPWVTRAWRNGFRGHTKAVAFAEDRGAIFLSSTRSAKAVMA